MAPRFPLFVDLDGRPCVVVGGGRVAARKAGTLLAFGARVTVIDPRPGEDIAKLSRRPPCGGDLSGNLSVFARPYAGPGDIAASALVIAAADDRELNARVARDAGAASIPVTVADNPALCSFFFPALVRRGDLVAGISTSGGCPRLASRLRSRLEKDWPQSLAEEILRLKEERGRLKETLPVNEVLRRLDLLIDEFLEESHDA
jgi:siroheme synthase-like protein